MRKSADESIRYERHLRDKSKEWEARCVRCGSCCGAMEDPCEHLQQVADGAYTCAVYDRRFGRWRTRSRKKLFCVPIREKLAAGDAWPGDERCGYKNR